MSIFKTVGLASALAIGLGLVGFPVASHANTYDLTIDNCTYVCNNGTNPFGTVTVTQDTTSLDFVVTLNGTYTFNPNGTGLDAFVFGFSTTPGAVTISAASIAAGFAVDTSLPQHEDGFGDFQNGITLDKTYPNTLSFSVANEILANLALSTSSGNGDGGTNVLFAADIVGNGTTGPVGGGDLSAVPLPPAALLFGTALVGMGILGRRRRKGGLAQAA